MRDIGRGPTGPKAFDLSRGPNGNKKEQTMIGPAPEEAINVPKKPKRPLNWDTSEETLNVWLRHLEEICNFEKIDTKTRIEALIGAIGKERFCYLLCSKYRDDEESVPFLEWWINNCDDGEPGTGWGME